jgi:hypothetical protein
MRGIKGEGIDLHVEPFALSMLNMHQPHGLVVVELPVHQSVDLDGKCRLVV